MPGRQIQVRQDENIEPLLLISDYPSFRSYWWVVENQALTNSDIVLFSIPMHYCQELPFLSVPSSEISVPNIYNIQAARTNVFCAPDTTVLSFLGWWGWTRKFQSNLKLSVSFLAHILLICFLSFQYTIRINNTDLKTWIIPSALFAGTIPFHTQTHHSRTVLAYIEYWNLIGL